MILKICHALVLVIFGYSLGLYVASAAAQQKRGYSVGIGEPKPRATAPGVKTAPAAAEPGISADWREVSIKNKGGGTLWVDYFYDSGEYDGTYEIAIPSYLSDAVVNRKTGKSVARAVEWSEWFHAIRVFTSATDAFVKERAQLGHLNKGR